MTHEILVSYVQDANVINEECPFDCNTVFDILRLIDLGILKKEDYRFEYHFEGRPVIDLSKNRPIYPRMGY